MFYKNDTIYYRNYHDDKITQMDLDLHKGLLKIIVIIIIIIIY